jgi:predicted esterase
MTNLIIELKKTEHAVRIPSQYLHLNADGTEKPLLIMIHGYADSAMSFVRRALPRPPTEFEVLAPNAPFPLPQLVEGEWKEAYAWYFADFARERILIHPTVAAESVALLVRQLGLEQRPKILCGFSQGGYFIPHLARELRNVERLITIGSGFQPDFYRKYDLRLPITAIHGEADEVVPYARSKTEFASLADRNTSGRFISLPKMTHTIDEAGRTALQDVLREAKR